MKLLIPLTFLAGLTLSQAAIVLTINISDPNAVVVTAVANNAQSAGSALVDFSAGISFENFFTGTVDLTAAVPITGTWTGRGTVKQYNEMVSFTYGSADVVPGTDLSIYHNVLDSDQSQIFVTTAPPFTGTSTFSLSGVSNLPAIGSTGNVRIGFDGDDNILGQYVVIPEPTSMVLMASSALLLIRRRRS